MSDEKTPYSVQPQPFDPPGPKPNPNGVPPSSNYTHQPMPATYPPDYTTPDFVNPTVTVTTPTFVGTPPLSSYPQHLSMFIIFYFNRNFRLFIYKNIMKS